ncbi:CoA-binding protein [Candidatus Woesearchaeota archaeon]|nr:CoA-binding protein [Candidatus Woesearchaeota archaeon]
MTKNKLDPLFNPKSIAVIGASRDHSSVGYGILKNILKGCVFENEYCKPFKGRIYAVNPNADEILNVQSYPKITDIKEDVDLAVIAVPAKLVPLVMKDSIKKKVKAMIVISAGFAELGEQGKKLQDEIKEIATKANIPLVGPNCLGIIRPSSYLNASFAPSTPPEGNIAFISQSGAIADSIIDWAISNRYGFSTLISYGNKAMLGVTDFLEWLEKDPETKAIAIYMEGIDNGKKFMEIAKKVTKTKPIIVLKAGRTEKGIRAISSHTGSLAGSYEIYKAAFKQSNVFSAETIEELFDLAKALADQPPVKENAVAIVTNGGGCGVICADFCTEFGINLVDLKKSTIKKLDATKKLHPAYSKSNPLDIIGDALPEQYSIAVNTLLDEDYIHGLIVIQTLQTMTNPEEDANVVIEAKKGHPEKAIVCTYMGGKYSQRSIRLLESHGIPDYNDLKKSAKAMWALIERGKQLKK